MKNYIITFTATLLMCSSIFAQKDTLNAVVQVENDYNPKVAKATKVTSTPQVEIQNNNTPLDIIFSQKTYPYRNFTGERNVKETLPKLQKQYPGYARLGYGTNNNIDAKAIYSIAPTKRDLIEMQGSFNGYSSSLDGVVREWDSRFFSTNVFAKYVHRFKPLSLGVEAKIRDNVFNYQTGNFFAGDTDKQNSASYSICTNVVSHNIGALSYKGYIEYNANTRKYSAAKEDRITENIISAGGNIEYQLLSYDFQKIGADIDVAGFLYNSAMRPQYGKGYSDYTSINFAPYYNFAHLGWNIRLGANVNILTANGSAFAISPNCVVEGSINKNITLFASATGGRTPNSFITYEELSPYWLYTPGDAQYTATYNVADLCAGTRFSFAPLSGGITVGYSYTKDDLLPCISTEDIIGTTFAQAVSRDLYVAFNIGYDYGGWLKFAADARYDHWSCTGSDSYLLYKPMIQAGVRAEARLYDGLFATIGYTFTGYTKANNVRNEEMNLLNAKINYKFHKQMAAYIEGNNLLSSEHQLFPGCEAQSANVLVGVSVDF
ncbi:MAG: hypothetical protein IKL29_06245 [Bacteroidaceae bacterium]|nr:hypothetical protein [Bacteroidaceae bacterium]